MRLRALLTLLALPVWAADATVDFDRKLRDWDGFGVNYVQARHTRDFTIFPQDYGGFSWLDEDEREQVIELVFGDEGLQPAILKMFCDSLHEPNNDNSDPYSLDHSRFDHETTTNWIRYFARRGLALTRARGDDLAVLAGLYGPPGWTTRQKQPRGRDLDPAMKEEVAEYIAAWALYLRDVEQLPVKYISMHNEGEHKRRWRPDGTDHPSHYSHDYNMWWPDYQVVDFLKYARGVLDQLGLRQIGITSGETTTWERFFDFTTLDGEKMAYARKIRKDPAALANLSLITSHGFNQKYDSRGIDLLREAKPELHAWTTSYTWGDMSLDIVEDARRHIYETKVNGLMPWATVHNDYESDKLSPPATFRVSGNANSPIKTNNGVVTVTKCYYHFKQMTRAGRGGMAVAHVESDDPDITLIAWASNGTKHPDALLVLNKAGSTKDVAVTVRGSSATDFAARLTTDTAFGDRNYEETSAFHFENGTLRFNAPPRSVTTFLGR